MQIALLLVAGTALWSTSFRGVFQFDDFGAILRSGWIGMLPPSAIDAIRSIRPLTELTFVLERRLFGTEPAGYHLLSVALHLASTLLVWRLCRRLARAERGDRSPFALLAALLFLVHPLATEAVTYLSGRASLLAACLSLLAVERWLAWRDRDEPPGVAWSSLCAFALALAAKETAAVVPAALALVDGRGTAVGARSAPRARFRAYLPHMLVLALFLATAASAPTYRRLLAHSVALRPPIENLVVQPRVTLESLALFARPDRLNIDHDLRAGEIRANDPLVAEGLAVAALVAVSCLAFARGSLAGFGACWFLLHLVPTCTLVARNDLLSERNLYLPSVGLAIAASALGIAAFRRAETIVPRRHGRPLEAATFTAVALVVAALATATVRRNALYADAVALWSDSVAKSPAKARPHANLGWSLELAGDLDGAIEEYRIAVRLEPDFAPTRESLVRAWDRKVRAATESPRIDHLSPPGNPPAE